MVGFINGSYVFVHLQNAYHFVKVLHGPWSEGTHILSEDIEGYFLLFFLWNAALWVPWFLILHLQISNFMCWTMKPLFNSPHSYCCYFCILYHCCCFHLDCFCFCFALFFVLFVWTHRGCFGLVIAQGLVLSLF